jgi:molybdopterin/thiamine biosynthesis adenylyltransferase
MAAAAAARVGQVNPAVAFTPVARFLAEADMERCLAGVDLCIDALGGIKDRPALARAANKVGVPLLTAAVAGQSGYVATVLPGQPNPAQFFGEDPTAAAENTLGTPAPAVATAASILCAEALGLLCGRAPRLAGSMLLFDLGQMSFETVRL